MKSEENMINNFLILVKSNWQAALAVALINLPLSIALAVASLGSSNTAIPMMGIITAIFGGLAASIFASNKHNIYGPAGSISVVLIAFLIAVEGDLLLVPILTFATALIIFIIQRLKLTKYIMLIPTSALSGFLMGVGLIIMFSQLNQALGIKPQDLAEGVIEKIFQTFSLISQIHIPSFLLFLGSFIFLFVYKYFLIAKKIPGAIPITFFGIAFGYIAHAYFPAHAVSSIETLKTSFSGLKFSLVDWSYMGDNLIQKLKDWNTMYVVFKFAGAVALIALLETLITSKAMAKKTKTTFNKDKEVFGLGMSNIFSGFAGGMPSTAVIVRTVFNADSGANSRVAAFMGALIVLLIAFLFFDYFAYIPMPVIAAILVNISVGLIDLKELSRYRNLDRVSFFIAFLVAVVTFLEDPIMGIVAGTAMALLFFIKDVSKGNIDVSVFRKGDFIDKISLNKYTKKQSEEDTIILRFPATINYINAESFLDQIEKMDKVKNVVFSFGQVVIVDIDGIELLDNAVEYLRNKNIKLYFTGIVSARLKAILDDKQYFQELSGKGRVFKSSAFVIDIVKKESL